MEIRPRMASDRVDKLSFDFIIHYVIVRIVLNVNAFVATLMTGMAQAVLRAHAILTIADVTLDGDTAMSEIWMEGS